MIVRSAGATALVLTTAYAVLAACGGDHSRPHHAAWVIRARLEFLSADLSSPRPAPSSYRLLFPYICGDLYGAPTTGDFIQPKIAPDGRFEMDLNRTHEVLLRSLEPTDFSLGFLRIAPPQARLARLAPAALQADGIEQIGKVEWVDGRSRRPLLLVYVDRAAWISGQTVTGNRPVRFDVRVSSAGYVWIQWQSDATGDLYRDVAPPADLILAVTPSGSP